MSDPMHEPNDFMGPKNYVEILYVLHTTNMERNILATEPCKIRTLLLLLYVTFDIIRDNSSQQLLLFEQLLSHSLYNTQQHSTTLNNKW